MLDISAARAREHVEERVEARVEARAAAAGVGVVVLLAHAAGGRERGAALHVGGGAVIRGVLELDVLALRDRRGEVHARGVGHEVRREVAHGGARLHFGGGVAALSPRRVFGSCAACGNLSQLGSSSRGRIKAWHWLALLIKR